MGPGDRRLVRPGSAGPVQNVVIGLYDRIKPQENQAHSDWLHFSRINSFYPSHTLAVHGNESNFATTASENEWQLSVTNQMDRRWSFQRTPVQATLPFFLNVEYVGGGGAGLVSTLAKRGQRKAM